MPISEAAAEKPARVRRGRPLVFSAQLVAFYCRGQRLTRRQGVNRAYAMEAVGRLIDATAAHEVPVPYRWLCDEPAAAAGHTRAIRWEILAELGRVADLALFWALVEALCGRRPATKDAVAMIRQARRQAAPPGSLAALTSVLCRAIDAYRTQHPTTSWAQVYAALENAREAVLEAERQAQGD